jgi:hypothetical protein
MPGCASSKKVPHSVSEIVFTLFGFHGDSIFLMLIGSRPVTTLRWRDFGMPLSREDVRVAKGPVACYTFRQKVENH